MKRLLLSLWLLLAILPSALRAADEKPADEQSTTGQDTDASAAGGVSISPDKGDLNPGDVLTISFPAPMVAADKIDMGNQPVPIVAKPAVDGTFLWKSQTEGEYTITRVVAGATHHFTLAPGLKDADAHPVTVPAWSADFSAPPFEITTDSEFHKQLSAQPRIPLSSTYDVDLASVAKSAWIQDRDTRAHFPIEVIQTTDGPPNAKEFQIAPTDPLPPNHTYDLVIEGVRESTSHQPLPYPAVFPLGDTHDLKVEWTGAFNQALDQPTIRIKFNDSIPPDAVKDGIVQITPDVPGIAMTAESDEIDLTGTFDLTQRYHITVSHLLKGEHGYPLAADSQWSASFPPRQPSLAFPGPRLYLRGKGDLKFAFLQSHTPAVTWKLASVPLEKLPAVNKRIDEYNEPEKDPLTGNPIYDPKTDSDKQKQTELLVDAFHLPVILTGTCPAADTAEDQLREVTATLPAGADLAGPFILEASSTLPDGRIAGGRALVFFSEYILTQKRSPDYVFLRIAKMSDAMPVAGIKVHVVNGENIEMDTGETDARGMVRFEHALLFPPLKPEAYLFIAETPGGPSIGFVPESEYFDAATESGPSRVPSYTLLITDRNLYRPGQEVKIKGILRDQASTGVAVPAGGEIHWEITQGDGDKVIGEGRTQLTGEGTFEATWPIPEKAALGDCTIRCSLNGNPYPQRGGGTSFKIEEYRVPLFTASLDTVTETGTAAHAKISSVFFHGGANVGAHVHWKAEWSTDGASGTANIYPKIGPALDPDNALTRTIEGDAVLDAQGQATLECEAPFKSNPAVGISHVNWTADFTSVDGQTLSAGASQTFSSSPVLLAVTADEKLTAPRGITVTMRACDPDDVDVTTPVQVTADLYHITTRTVKEQVAPLVVRYRNTDEYTKVDSRDGVATGSNDTAGTLVFSATQTGDYIVAVHTRDNSTLQTPLVSVRTTVTGDQPAEVAVENETGFKLTTRDKPWEPGDTAAFTVESPFAGVAWVSIETDRILDTMLIPLAGNTGRIEIPVKPEYAPNAAVSVYLTRPGGPSALPVERFATAPLQVRRPDRELFLAPILQKPEVRPGQTIHGEVLATSQGKPLAGADLAVFAVDDAVLKLGEWALPDILATFYPQNPVRITNYRSLSRFIDEITTKNGVQKGFVIGDGSVGEGAGNTNNIRKEFKTLAYWNANLKTGADGKVAFEFQAPDNLTSYRIVAIGDTQAGQFGADASQTVKINKPLMIDPALPRFVRDGDEVELRAVVRQNFADATTVTAKCIVGDGCTLTAEPVITGTALRDAPCLLRYRAKITDKDLKSFKVRFEAQSNSDHTMADAVEVTIPVSAPTITRHESIAGSFNGPGFDAVNGMPKDWLGGNGAYTTTLSTCTWLPAIAGIPTILDYPHGCFEQITSKLLCYSLLANLMDYLPGTAARMDIYKGLFQHGVEQIGTSLLPDGRLPYWPGDSVGDDYVTCQACWALNEAAGAGFDIPAGLTDKLAAAVARITTDPSDPDTRAFALFVLATMKSGGDYSAAAEDIYLHRTGMGYDGRAMLALAAHRLNIMPKETAQLLHEIDKTIAPSAFKPATFGSMTRTEGIVAMAFETIALPDFTDSKKTEIRKRLLHIMDSASILSTQENLWLLLAFKEMLDAQGITPLSKGQPAPLTVSKNSSAAAWDMRKLGDPFAISGLNHSALTFLMQADYSRPELDTPRVDRGFRVERVVRNLTAAARTGTPAAPYRIGDQLLITYRVRTQKQQYYVALEDSLPAAFETVNPDLAQIAKFFTLPPADPADQLLDLSHSELRDRTTLLYFDDMPPGSGVYSILARVTAAGAFRWPQTQVTPMYDSRFSGLSASSTCTVSAQ